MLELALEQELIEAFPHDEIIPVAKGVRGADIKHIIKSPRGYPCGIILWEVKRTQNWQEKWIDDIKRNLIAAKADIPIIVSEQMPKGINENFGSKNDVWICGLSTSIGLAMALRKGLLDVGYQKAIMTNKGGKADSLYEYITSTEFKQHIKTTVEIYNEIISQVIRERGAYEKIWSQREKQAQRLVTSVASIVGSIQGKIGANTLQIPELDLLDSGGEN